jgi:predicted RNA-binding Zn ribbon-like protein
VTPAPRASTGALSSEDDQYVFDLDGGRLCLDFANTRSQRTGEHLTSYPALLAFARQSGLLTRAEDNRLQSLARRKPAEADGVLVRARALRDALYAIFSAIAAGRQPRQADMDHFNTALLVTMTHARVLPSAAGFVWGWAGGLGGTLEAPLWPVVRSAADVLTSPELGTVRECSAGDCAWLFMDTSKNRSRQWCSMQSCGNREKARRHYQRLRARREPPSTPEAGDTPRGRGRARRQP